jgi:regulatory protein
MFKQPLTPQQAKQKIKHYCGYQERSHKEVQDKLYSMGLYKKDVEIIITELIEEGYLNEERYAIAFAGGRFRMKQWGKVKIEYELKQKRVSTYNIKKALKEIDEEAYTGVLEELAQKKWDSLKGEQYINRQAKTTAYLLQKGYESPLVSKAVAKARAGNATE